jgi:hypothetical protein
VVGGGELWAVLAAADTRRRHIEWENGGCRVQFVEDFTAVLCELRGGDYDLRNAVRETEGKPEPPPCDCKP